MDLARIDDAAENAFLEAALSVDTWIGATDAANEDTWLWAHGGTAFWQGDDNGSPVGGAFANWDMGEPDYRDCAVLDDDGGQWKDDECSDGNDYLCQGVGPRRSAIALAFWAPERRF